MLSTQTFAVFRYP